MAIPTRVDTLNIENMGKKFLWMAKRISICKKNNYIWPLQSIWMHSKPFWCSVVSVSHNALFLYTREYAYASLFGSFSGSGGCGGSSAFMISQTSIIEQGTTLSSNLGSGWECCVKSIFLGDDGMGGCNSSFHYDQLGGWIHTHVLYILVGMDKPYSTNFCVGPFTRHGDTPHPARG